MNSSKLKGTVCIVGMGYVGMTLAILLCKSGFRVIGVESDYDKFLSLQNGYPCIAEHITKENYLHFLSSGLILISSDICNIQDCNVYIVTVNTPLYDDKTINLNYIKHASNDIVSVLKTGDLVLIRSTVTVGATRNIVKPILDKKMVRYFLAVAPERIVEGAALEELSGLPQIIGGVDSESTEEATKFFSSICKEIVCLTSSEAAELTKLICNTQRDIQFAYANELALIAEALDLCVHEVIQAANYNYPRSCLPAPGLVGGPCLEKDAHVLSESLNRRGVTPTLTLKGRELNENIIKYGVLSVIKKMEEIAIPVETVTKIAIIGLAFKGSPPIADMRGTLAVPLFVMLKSYFPQADIVGYDPMICNAEASKFGIKAVGIDEALSETHIAFIQTNHFSFYQTGFIEKIIQSEDLVIIYDFWNVLGSVKSPSTKNILTFGGNSGYGGCIPIIRGMGK